MSKLDERITKMGLINITSDRKNVTLDSDVILYIIMNGKIAEQFYNAKTRRAVLARSARTPES